MKKTEIIFVAALCIAAMSCSKIQQDTPSGSHVGSLSITANADTKTTLNTDGKGVLWLSGENLFVTYGETNTVTFVKDNQKSASAVFATDMWPEGEVPTYASSFGKRVARAKYLDGKMCVHITDEQRMMWQKNYYKSASASVGKVEKIGNVYTVSEMKNVMGLIKFTLTTKKVARIHVEAIGGEMLSGTAAIDYDKLIKGDEDFWTAVPSPDPEVTDYNMSYINVVTSDPTQPETYPYITPSTYYICVYPQHFSKGLRFTVYDSADQVITTRTVGSSSGFKIARNEIREIKGSLDDDDTLPADFTLKLDFYNDTDTNPFGATFPEGSNQSATDGETYNFSYTYKYYDKTKTATFPFVLCKGTVNDAYYSYFGPKGMVYGEQGKKVLVFTGKQWWIKLPAVKGRYLKSVTVSHGNGYVKRTFIYTTPYVDASTKGDVCNYTSNSATAIATSEHLNTETMSFPNTLQYAAVHKTQINTPYYLCGQETASSIRIYHLEISYTSTMQ